MYQNRIDGGDNGARTRDLLTASQALSQLSYTPVTIYTILEKAANVKRKSEIFLFSLIFSFFLYRKLLYPAVDERIER